MTTLADMPPEEHDETVGMWCDFEATPGCVITTIIIKAGNDLEFEDEYEVFNPVIGHELAQPEQITPRFDLPRACSPDGTPPAGKWEHAEYLGDHKGMTDVYYFDGEPTHRRWVGEWEQA